MRWICAPAAMWWTPKSILGIFSLDLSKPITLDVYDDNCDDLIADIQQFTI